MIAGKRSRGLFLIMPKQSIKSLENGTVADLAFFKKPVTRPN
jgi:hypothetical protein